jgi:glycosyltransferase involved in cell wall biosynthesis
MNNNTREISVVIPVYNEEGGLPELYKRLTAALKQISNNYELIFVNDGSKDKTPELLVELSKNDKRVKYISFSRNFGHQVAISSGLDFAKGNAVVIIDGDLQDPPELIPELYKKYKEGFKVVYAKRKSRKGETLFKKATANIFYRLLKRITSIDIPLDTGDFRLIDKKVVEQLKVMPEKSKFLRGQIAWLGFKQTFVEFERDARKYGSTDFTTKKMFRFAMDGITGFSDFPLRLASWLGLIVSSFAFIVILYALYTKFILKGGISGWTSTIISAMFIGGIQLLTIGIIGEYINRINTETRNRPLYIIEDSNTEEDEKEQGD